MEVALVILVAVLLVLIVWVSAQGLIKSRAARQQEQSEAGVTAGEAEAQHGRSVARQADARAAHAERSSEVGSDTDE
jgi:hypothetical protein